LHDEQARPDLPEPTGEGLREELELNVMELLDSFGWDARKIHRSVNDAIRAHERGDRGTLFLERLWAKESA
jgi:hypothetical protein